MKLSKAKKQQLINEAKLLYMIDNLTLKEIARKLNLSERTVGTWFKSLKPDLDNPDKKEEILKKMNRINYQFAIANIFKTAKKEDRQLTPHELNAVNIYNLNLENNK